MKRILIATLILSAISSLFMVRFYFASVEIYHEYVNENTLIYLNSVSNIDELPEWTTVKSLWHIINIDYLIRIIFMIVILWVIVKLINRRETMIIPLFTALAISIGSFFFMILYFAASSDIYNEYVNKNIIQSVNNFGNIASLAASANCPMEWGFTIVDFVLRAMFMLYISVLLVKCILTKEKQVAPLK